VNLDLTSPLGVTLGLLPEVVLTVVALIALLSAAWGHQTVGHSTRAGWLSLIGVLGAGAGLGWLWAGGAQPSGTPHMVALDPFRFAAGALILLAAAATILLSLRYLEREAMLAPEYYPLILFATIGMLLLAGADDLMVLFLGLEVMSIAVYVLAGFNRRSAHSAEAALKYFLMGAFASAFLLYGIALVYGVTGTTSMTTASMALSRGQLPLMGAMGLGMLLIGFGFKVAAAPFHMWTPDVYEGSPTPVTGFMATGVKVAGFAALARLLVIGFPAAAEQWQPVVTGLALLSMLVGNLIALNQRSLKRMLAYSSVAHAGYLLAALVTGSSLGATAMLVYLLGYTLTSLAAFGLLAILGRDGEREITLDGIAGLATRRPWLAAGLAICMLSLLGFPGTLGFIGKWMILVALVGQQQYLVSIVLVLASLVSAGYYLPVIMASYMRPAGERAGERESVLAGPARLTIVVAVALVLVLGVWPTPAIDLALSSAGSLFQGLVAGIHATIR